MSVGQDEFPKVPGAVPPVAMASVRVSIRSCAVQGVSGGVGGCALRERISVDPGATLVSIPAAPEVWRRKGLSPRRSPQHRLSPFCFSFLRERTQGCRLFELAIETFIAITTPLVSRKMENPE